MKSLPAAGQGPPVEMTKLRFAFGHTGDTPLGAPGSANSLWGVQGSTPPAKASRTRCGRLWASIFSMICAR